MCRCCNVAEQDPSKSQSPPSLGNRHPSRSVLCRQRAAPMAVLAKVAYRCRGTRAVSDARACGGKPSYVERILADPDLVPVHAGGEAAKGARLLVRVALVPGMRGEATRVTTILTQEGSAATGDAGTGDVRHLARVAAIIHCGLAALSLHLLAYRGAIAATSRGVSAGVAALSSSCSASCSSRKQLQSDAAQGRIRLIPSSGRHLC